ERCSPPGLYGGAGQAERADRPAERREGRLARVVVAKQADRVEQTGAAADVVAKVEVAVVADAERPRPAMDVADRRTERRSLAGFRAAEVGDVAVLGDPEVGARADRC